MLIAAVLWSAAGAILHHWEPNAQTLGKSSGGSTKATSPLDVKAELKG